MTLATVTGNQSPSFCAPRVMAKLAGVYCRSRRFAHDLVKHVLRHLSQEKSIRYDRLPRHHSKGESPCHALGGWRVVLPYSRSDASTLRRSTGGIDSAKPGRSKPGATLIRGWPRRS